MGNKKIKYKNLILIIIALVLILVVLIMMKINNNKKENETPNNNNTTTINVNNKENDKVKVVDTNSKTRPYAVMINNIGVARPLQSGLQDAYIIYEMIVEGGLTRYLALFKDQKTTRIGSIRSARHYYLDYALENDAIYVHHGQSPQAQSDFSKLNVDRIVVDSSKTGWRDKKLKVSSEHTLFTNIEKLNKGLNKLRTETNKDLLLNYSTDEVNLEDIENKKTANKVSIKYSSSMTSSYEYDDVNKVYKRFVNGKTHTDYVTKKQYTFKNIITYKVKNYTLNDSENKGRQGLENIGSGEGYYITNGYATKIKWEKKCRECQTEYTLNGEKLKVNDGNTFIQIQPIDQSLVIE